MRNPEKDSRSSLSDVLDMLDRARKSIDKEYGSDGQLARVVLHLIDCAADASALLAEAGDLETAREALASARSAVIAATCAVRHTHDDMKATTA